MLTGCGGDNVVVQPIALKPIPAKLTVIPDVPKCDLAAGRKDYSPAEVTAYATCWRAAYDALFVKHKGLIKAVRVREAATQKALTVAAK